MRTIGLDVGKSFAEVAVVETSGLARPAGRIGTSPDQLRAFAATLGPEDQVVLEATTNTWAIAELLGAHAGRVVVSNPIRTRAIADAKTKTDTIDAATLAELLAANYLPEVWQPDPATQELRRRLAARAALVGERRRLRNRISAVLARNLRCSPWSDPFGVQGLRWLASVELPADEREQIDAALRLLTSIEAEVRRAEATLARAVVDDARVRRLLTIPGIGPMASLGLLAAIGDIARFSRPNKLVSYLGLDPRVRQSGGRPAHIGHISRAGQSYARSLLVEAAHAAVRVPGPLRVFHARIAARRGPGVAAVAVARKLAVLAWHVLADGTEYRWGPAHLAAFKLRSLERQAGRPSLRGRVRGDAESRARSASERELERLRLQRVEAEYAAFVQSRRIADAAAANGVRLNGQRPAARRSSTPRSALRLGVDRVRADVTPGRSSRQGA